jgi:predicted amidohydrolase
MNPSPEKNLVIDPKFENNESTPGVGSTPDWTFIAPRAELAPRHAITSENSGNGVRLQLQGDGDKRAFGCWRGRAELEAGAWYHAQVHVRLREIQNPHLSIFAQLARHFLLPKNGWGEETVLEQIFYHDPNSASYDGDHFEFYLTASEKGSAEFFEPQVVKIEKPQHRIARVATIRFSDRENGLTLEMQRERISDRLDMAGALKPDIVALTEFCPVIGVPKSEYISWENVAEKVPDGPLCRLLSEKAKQYNMHILCGNIERRGKYIFNTAVIFGRDGSFIGQYDKTHLTFSELTEGFSCSDSYPVFDLDFGRIGAHICYDEWFPEIARHYAHKGVEILFLPVAGGKPITWRTRALDNGIYFVSAATTPPSMIISSSGAIIAQTHDDGVACADLNLDWRFTNHYGDPTRTYGMPCITPQMRNCLDDDFLNELNQAMRRPQVGSTPPASGKR